MDPDIKGFKVGQTTHNINLFADDVLLYLTDPSHSLAHLQDLFNTYGTVSGYKVNFDKIEILPLTTSNYSVCQSTSVFKWTPTRIKYLSIVVDNNLNKFLLIKLQSTTKKDWGRSGQMINLPIILIGWINWIKMNILQRLQYLFQLLPTLLPQTVLGLLIKI